ncbi:MULTISPECIES: hypothetical protein [Corallococcus]|uniref:hypothetical protein n=1 Tax=Corallococcus TaxID=83461 RepID=UPI001180C9CE|nr:MULTISPECIES: hypothetical protein [Corallococcus]NBD09369.1 hypothetical protein [Corallococcus silvisoli]TSC31330.1 hypothetical protein FOF48_11650 [Corallococcus sp. Z5C101001]
MRLTPSAALLFAASLCAACGGPLAEEHAAAGVTDESVASQEQDLDESCVGSDVVLAQPDGAVVTAVIPNCSYSDSAAASNDSNYDQPSCPHRFVTEVTGLGGNFAQPFVEVIPATSNVTESACKGLAISGAAFGYKGGVWWGLGELTTNGVWYPATLFWPAHCGLRFNIGSGGSGYSKIRVTGLGAALGVFKTRVRTGVRLGTGPC